MAMTLEEAKRITNERLAKQRKGYLAENAYMQSPENIKNAGEYVKDIRNDYTPYGLYHYGKDAVKNFREGDYRQGTKDFINAGLSGIPGAVLLKKGIKSGYQGLKNMFSGPLSPQYHSGGTRGRLINPIVDTVFNAFQGQGKTAFQKGLKSQAPLGKRSDDFMAQAKKQKESKEFESEMMDLGQSKRDSHLIAKLKERNPGLKYRTTKELIAIKNDLKSIKPSKYDMISPHEAKGSVWSPSLKGRVQVLYNKVGDEWIPGTILNPQGKFQ